MPNFLDYFAFSLNIESRVVGMFPNFLRRVKLWIFLR